MGGDEGFRRRSSGWRFRLSGERVVIGLLVLIVGLGAYNSKVNSDQIGSIDEAQNAVGALNATLTAQVQADCERGNETRPQLIKVYQAIARGNRGRHRAAARLLRRFGVGLPDPVVDFLHEDGAAAKPEARTLHEAAVRTAEAQAPVALYPHANLRLRSLVDCSNPSGRVR